MREDHKQGGSFEERLLDELKSVVTDRAAEEASAGPPRAPLRRRRSLTAGAAAVLIAAAALLVFKSGGDGTSKAFAVEPQSGGGVTIRVLSPEDAPGLEAALGEAGIRSDVTWLPAGMTCREPRFTPSTVKTPLGGSISGMTMAGPGEAMTIGVLTTQQYRERRREYMQGEISADEYHASTPNISLDPAGFRPDQTVVIWGSPGPYRRDPEGGYEARFGIAEGPVEPCKPVRVSDGGLLGGMNAVLEEESAADRAGEKAAGETGSRP